MRLVQSYLNRFTHVTLNHFPHHPAIVYYFGLHNPVQSYEDSRSTVVALRLCSHHGRRAHSVAISSKPWVGITAEAHKQVI
jgi:hypothetical protein